jgi:uncharacterized protein YjbI with pentapeptide repeats
VAPLVAGGDPEVGLARLTRAVHHAPHHGDADRRLQAGGDARILRDRASAKQADFYRANLAGADLTNADFRGSRLEQADLNGALTDGMRTQGALLVDGTVGK